MQADPNNMQALPLAYLGKKLPSYEDRQHVLRVISYGSVKHITIQKCCLLSSVWVTFYLGALESYGWIKKTGRGHSVKYEITESGRTEGLNWAKQEAK